MNFDSDDDVKEDPTKLRRTAQGLKSIFASDAASAPAGQSLKYEGPRNRNSGDDFLPSAKTNNLGAPPVPSAGQTTIACNGAVHAYRGDDPIGAAAVLIANSQQAGTVAVVVDRTKRHLCRVRVNDNLQLLPNPAQRQYATLYDPSFGGHWTLAFKDVPSCNAFVAGALTVQHFMLLPDGPRAPFVEISVASEGPMIKKGDTVSISLSVWLMQRKGSMTTTGKLVEEIVDEAPRRVVIGEHTVMTGVEDALIGMGPGGRKLIFVPPKKTKQSGLGNPEIGQSDPVVALVSVAAVEPYDPSLGLDDAQRSAQANQGRQRGMSMRGDDGGPSSDRGRKRGASRMGDDYDRPSQQQQQQQQAVATVPQQTAAAPAPGGDTNALIQALLLRTLTEKSEPKPAAPEPAAASKQGDTSSRGDGAAFVERSLTMLQQQLSALYEKMDRLDIDQKLEVNNQKIERMVKKAVGKVPTLDVDVEDAGKDREELLARIEQLKEKVEQSKEDYYAALETMGKHKDEVVALRNDVQIAVRSGEEKVQELKERNRLELVDAEVRFRKELDKVFEQRFTEGRERGYAEGFGQGRVEGLTESGSSSTEDLREKLAAKEGEVLETQARLVELEARGYEERRQALEQQATLQAMIDRLEQRNASKEKSVVDAGAMNAKFLRRVMNSAYAAIETQFYATDKDTVEVSEALNMVLVAIKSETRQAADELKKIAIINSKEITPAAPLPFETGSRAGASAGDDSAASPSAVSAAAGSGASPPPPPPPPPPGMFGGGSRPGSVGAGGSIGSQLDNLDNTGGFTLGAGGGNASTTPSPTTSAAPQQEEEQKKEGGEEGDTAVGGDDEEDEVMRMLKEYRAQRDKELAAEQEGADGTASASVAGGGGGGGADGSSSHADPVAAAAAAAPVAVPPGDVPAAFGDADYASYQHESVSQVGEQQQQHPEAVDEEQAGGEEETDVAAAPAVQQQYYGDEDEDEEEEPVKPVKLAKRAKPPKAKVAQADDDDWE